MSMEMSIQKVLNEFQIVHGDHNLDVAAQIEEEAKDISFFMSYRNQGDESLVVVTRDGHVYEYSLYANREFFNPRKLDRFPVLYRPIEYGEIAHVSNEIFRIIHEAFCEKCSTMFNKKYPTTEVAQAVFESTMRKVHRILDSTTVVVDETYFIHDIEEWMKTNGIDTNDDYFKSLVHQLHNKSVYNGQLIVGIAGKKELKKDDFITADENGIDFVWRQGETLEPESLFSIGELSEPDEWGFSSLFVYANDIRTMAEQVQLEMDI